MNNNGPAAKGCLWRRPDLCLIPLLLLHDVTSSLLLRKKLSKGEPPFEQSPQTHRASESHSWAFSLPSLPFFLTDSLSWFIHPSTSLSTQSQYLSPSPKITSHHGLAHTFSTSSSPLHSSLQAFSLPFSVFLVPSDISCFHGKCFI